MGYGKYLKQAALEKGISIRKLGLITGISPDTLYSAIRRDTGLRFDQALRVAEYLEINPDRICGQCYFGDQQDTKAKTEALIAGLYEGRKKALIQKHIETLIEFDEDQLDIAEVFLIMLKGMNLAEGIWLMNLVSAALHYPDELFEEWLGEEDNREQISGAEQAPEQVVKEAFGAADAGRVK